MSHTAKILLPVLLTASAALSVGFAAPASAQAGNIYSFTDERGVVHFSNLPHLDKRYKLVYKGKGGGYRVAAYSAPSAADIARYSPVIDAAARQNGLDPALLHAVIRAESGYNPRALSIKGATGLMQLIPDTARRYGVANIYDPTENIYGGARYLKDLLAMFNNDVELALAGYNAGENAVIRAGRRIPNYPETMAYVPKVIGFLRTYGVPKV
jgi:soluble lytic murein transglycosylase-like protein